ncbi:MAG TPA: AmmeMemoRadiSam system protein A [Methylomusa anaerophila]|uniref:3,4-dihydroxyphenylacetate 2,3-dioxygenase n=1 Tax=Methylomusa anaerophila TaxID=1930071 RepID=A0A348AK14_9FIRM|nr:AmmeMemoRadiSam system protein A [Methylomusa anaerophila]BBB91412.1 3,4-dihydroxyphenylacetate 2,3-dioxygenase [Methylomusa anaerophila]HML90163.1 AmmeMemoRadiSam system protein A [Methylomusa anaerophila]
MENLVGCALMPHPPIMIPEVGKHELTKIKKTVEAATKVSETLKEANPQTIVIITPHGPVFNDAVTVSVHPRLRGSFTNFGVPDVVLGFETDSLLMKHIIRSCQRLGVNLLELTDDAAKNYRISLQLDHGALVPLYYLTRAGFKGQIVHLTMGMLPYEEMYTFGKAVQTAINSTDKRVAVIASGDLSHRLIPGAPAGFSPKGAEFDRLVIEALKNVDVKALLNLDQDLVEEAGQCGLRPIFFLLGVMGGLDVAVDTVSYEGPFGVGYGIVSFKINGKRKEEENATGTMGTESAPVTLAKASLKYYLENKRLMQPPQAIAPVLAGQAGAFVSFKKDGELRGCIGTFAPTQPTIAEEIIRNAVSAGTEDPRFWPIELDELPELDVSVDILSEPEPVTSFDLLDPKKYGVIVRKGRQSGLLLPDLEGVDTVQDQVSIARRKAGIRPDEQIELYRFTVTRYK